MKGVAGVISVEVTGLGLVGVPPPVFLFVAFCFVLSVLVVREPISSYSPSQAVRVEEAGAINFHLAQDLASRRNALAVKARTPRRWLNCNSVNLSIASRRRREKWLAAL